MKNELSQWSKEELKIYILMLCAKIDSEESKVEINLIKSKVDSKIFKRIYKEFRNDDEDTCFEKIEYVIGKHEYSHKELSDLKNEVLEVFNSDKNFENQERYLYKVLDNILY
ncbi:hypothetical protein [Yeosuana sp.]|uniref:hypothetical protein n=1 Tax=Yeosuana sp. TaxID=2529388 RepID=UPI004054EEB2